VRLTDRGRIVLFVLAIVGAVYLIDGLQWMLSNMWGVGNVPSG
jgi:hypothetical protein